MSINDLVVLSDQNRVVQQIVAEYADNKTAEINDAKETLDREHWEILDAFKAIANTECAKLKIGRRGCRTRIIWMQDVKNITSSKPKKVELSSDESSCEDQFSGASLNQLIDAIKSYHNVTSVHLVY